MTVSNGIIKVLDALAEKFGLMIDWTSDNVLPYLEQLCEKYIKWEIATSIAWIIMSSILIVIGLIFVKVVDSYGMEKVVFWCILIIAFIVIGTQVFDIIQCCIFPEKQIYEYIQYQIQSMQ